MIPALHTRESVEVDLPWSTWAMTDMFRMLAFLSMMARIWSTVRIHLGRVEEGEVMTGQHSRKDPWHRDFDQ